MFVVGSKICIHDHVVIVGGRRQFFGCDVADRDVKDRA